MFDLLAEKLRAARMVRPGVTVLERLIATARDAVHVTIARCLKKLLTQSLHARLDTLLVVDPTMQVTRLAWLRQRAVDNTSEEINRSLDKIPFLRKLSADAWDLAAIPPNRRKWLTVLCKHTRNQALQLTQARRHPALLAFLAGMLEEHTDIVIGLVDVCLHTTESQAKRDIEQFHKKHAKATNKQGHYFALMGKVILNDAIPNSEVRPTILARIPRDDLELAVREQETIGRPLDDNGLDFFHARYAYLHQFSARCLDTLHLHAHPEAALVPGCTPHFCCCHVASVLHFTKALTLASGGTSHLPDEELKPYLYTAINAQACNYGITRLAQMADLSYATLHWVSEWYLGTETLQAANALIVCLLPNIGELAPCPLI